MASKSSRVSAHKPTSTVSDGPANSGAESVAGLHSATFSSLPEITCPLCATRSVGVLIGKASFSVTISGEDLLNSDQPAVGIVCSNSHFFILREKDVFRRKPN
jgi:hypothetical protein